MTPTQLTINGGLVIRNPAGVEALRLRMGSHGDMWLFQIIDKSGWLIIEMLKSNPESPVRRSGLPLIDIAEFTRRFEDLPTVNPEPGDDEIGYIPIVCTDYMTGKDHVISIRRKSPKVPK